MEERDKWLTEDKKKKVIEKEVFRKHRDILLQHVLEGQKTLYVVFFLRQRRRYLRSAPVTWVMKHKTWAAARSQTKDNQSLPVNRCADQKNSNPDAS